MTNITQLDGIELRKCVQSLLGLRVVKVETYWNIYAPDGSLVEQFISSEAEAWEHHVLPVEESIDYALALPVPEGWEWQTSYRPDAPLQSAALNSPEKPIMWQAAPTLPIAICRVWALWKSIEVELSPD
ncbi:MAG: hypothetical protein K8L91_01545 [Anaerolineae bacterium]|nr:hypothetical protein [Anaerolineae bacterium]